MSGVFFFLIFLGNWEKGNFACANGERKLTARSVVYKQKKRWHLFLLNTFIEKKKRTLTFLIHLILTLPILTTMMAIILAFNLIKQRERHLAQLQDALILQMYE